MPTSSDLANWTKWWFLGRGRGWLSWLRWSNKTIWQCQFKYWPCQTKEFIILPAFGLREIPTSSSKTVNPLDPRRKFCQYWPRECNLTAEFDCLAPSNQPITELGPLSTNQIPGLLGKWVRKKTLSLVLSKLPLCGSKGLTVFGASFL